MQEEPAAATIITDTETLSAFCARLSSAPFVTVDTEFLRESTFWAQLCLVQMAGPDEAAIIDPLAEGIDLAPFYRLMQDERVVKVFHAARQDVEIFNNLRAMPRPLFDTQVAAMAAGKGRGMAPCSTPRWRPWRRASANRSPTTRCAGRC